MSARGTVTRPDAHDDPLEVWSFLSGKTRRFSLLSGRLGPFRKKKDPLRLSPRRRARPSRRGAMADAAAAIEEELEALEALYPDDGLVVRRAGDAREDGSGASTTDEKAVRHTMVSLDVAPRTLDDETQQYVLSLIHI